ncbi:hypothetical protein PPERSA_03652 [Pseudocohnilembus persalinus]|uniref:AMP-dependent synthetase/ligase domain-containing protein n=1 Tax=Pseudocohnilembus persalinus TaxID=266149 RepID=A0A0V0R790_PSEPJ|nr:hypothetical protein PPERSA_03652 [Pseudocohnilembus persalinus]|eukprot:KRX10345.1 hypothetical protein PPERSA_03652 [Pseudocohnilembus persalinus]
MAQNKNNNNQQYLTRYPLESIGESLYSTKEGIQQVIQKSDPNVKGKNVIWTTDYTHELPVVMKKDGLGSTPPKTIPQIFKQNAEQFGNLKALSVKIKGQWQSINYREYYEQAQTFAKGLISLGIQKQRAVNIIGFNHPCWNVAFMGSIFGQYMPVGVYTTNGPEACQYVAENSDAEVIVVENRTHLAKYLQVWDQLPLLKYVIVYNDILPSDLPVERKGQVLDWNQLLEKGRMFRATTQEDNIEYRQENVTPGQCCTLVYTSGTTGNPKGVMLSHDNYTWTAQAIINQYDLSSSKGNHRLVSFLPLSHVVAQVLDIVGSMISCIHVYFADSTALQGSLVNYLQEIRPTVFFSVPRVWEKIQEKMLALASSNGIVKQKIGNWAKSIGVQGTQAEFKGEKLPTGFGIAKKIVYDNIKKAIGLDQAKYVIVGAAPLSPSIRQYFLSLNIYIINGYGMSESSGPQQLSNPVDFEVLDEEAAKSCGKNIEGTDILIANPDIHGEGEICFKGRNRFMGYYKNEKATMETIDEQGYLHSGDLGKLDKNGNLYITGRLKELIITAGGENVAPVLIEDEIKDQLKFISNVMVVGDQKKYLACLLTFKHELSPEGQLIPNKILPEALNHIKALGSSASTIDQAKQCPIIRKAIEEGIAKANERAISKAQRVQKWVLIDGDFTVDGGHLTPTMKLKRKVVTQMYTPQIESMYIEAKL